MGSRACRYSGAAASSGRLPNRRVWSSVADCAYANRPAHGGDRAAISSPLAVSRRLEPADGSAGVRRLKIGVF